MAKAKAKSGPTKAVAVSVENAPPGVGLQRGSARPPSSIAPPGNTRVIAVQTEARGSSGTSVYAGYFSEEYLNELTGTAAADAYDKMRRSDARCKMSLQAVKTPIMAAEWEIHAATQDNPEHKEHAEFIKHVLFVDMDKPFSKLEALSLADFGFSISEVTHKAVIDHPRFASYVGLKSLGWRSPKSVLSWNLDPATGAIESVRQLVTGDLQRYIDIPGKFLLVSSLEKEGDNYEGVSLLRAAYGAWKRKNMYLRLMAIGMERNAIPTPTVEVPEGKQNTEEYTFLTSCLENYASHENSYFAYPAGWLVKFLESPFDPEKLKSAIDMENQEIVAAFMANFLMLGQSQSGSRAVSMDQSQFFLGAIQYIADESVKGINHTLIPNLIKMKYGPQDAYPVLKITGISDKAGKELADSLKALAEGQFIQPDDELEEHLRQRFGVTKKSDKGVRIVKPQDSMAAMSPNEVEGEPIKASEFAIPEERRYPIGTASQAADALRRSVGKPGASVARANILKRWPTLWALDEAIEAKHRAAPKKKASGSLSPGKPLRLAEYDSDRLQFVTHSHNICPTCDELDGSVWDADDPDLPSLPLHPNCECELVAYSGNRDDTDIDPDLQAMIEELDRETERATAAKDERDEVDSPTRETEEKPEPEEKPKKKAKAKGKKRK